MLLWAVFKTWSLSPLTRIRFSITMLLANILIFLYQHYKRFYLDIQVIDAIGCTKFQFFFMYTSFWVGSMLLLSYDIHGFSKVLPQWQLYVSMIALSCAELFFGGYICVWSWWVVCCFEVHDQPMRSNQRKGYWRIALLAYLFVFITILACTARSLEVDNTTPLGWVMNVLIISTIMLSMFSSVVFVQYNCLFSACLLF